LHRASRLAKEQNDYYLKVLVHIYTGLRQEEVGEEKGAFNNFKTARALNMEIFPEGELELFYRALSEEREWGGDPIPLYEDFIGFYPDSLFYQSVRRHLIDLK